jgi:CubicO group peptidase (beta-lactamase class C family)
MKTWVRLRNALGLLSLALPAFGHSGVGEKWPTQEWPESNPAAQGLNSAVLQRLDAEFAAGKHGYVDGMLVIRHGQVVFEKSYQHDYDAAFAAQTDQQRGPYNYFDPDWHPYYRRGPLHTMQSVSKSVMATLIGIAIADGKIAGAEQEVLGAFDDFPDLDRDARRAAMTLGNLLTMRSGIRWDEDTFAYTDARNTCAAMEASGNWTGFVLGQPMASAPGRAFVYSSGDTMLLDHILFRATGQHALAYAAARLFAPLGIREYYWKQTPSAETDAEGGLYLRARDLAKLGYLYLHDGVWEGRRILPEGWVAAATSAQAVPGSDAGDWRYGYQWWLVPYGGDQRKHAPAAIGYGGQQLLVLPEYDLIAVFTGWNIFGTPALSEEYTLQYLLEAIARPP